MGYFTKNRAYGVNVQALCCPFIFPELISCEKSNNFGRTKAFRVMFNKSGVWDRVSPRIHFLILKAN